jgi:hypothetical protein
MGWQLDSDRSQNDSMRFEQWLGSHAHYVLLMEPLETGYSQEIHGQITLLRGGLWDANSLLPTFTPQILHYRCLDHTVRFYVPGYYKGFI